MPLIYHAYIQCTMSTGCAFKTQTRNCFRTTDDLEMEVAGEPLQTPRFRRYQLKTAAIYGVQVKKRKLKLTNPACNIRRRYDQQMTGSLGTTRKYFGSTASDADDGLTMNAHNCEEEDVCLHCILMSGKYILLS